MSETYTVKYREEGDPKVWEDGGEKPWERNERAEMAFDAALKLLERGDITTNCDVVDITARGGTYYYEEVDVTVKHTDD